MRNVRSAAWVLALLLPVVSAAPTISSDIEITSPIQSQAHLTAFAGDWFQFQFAPDTFTQNRLPADPIHYLSLDAPSWLTLHASNRTWNGWAPLSPAAVTTVRLGYVNALVSDPFTIAIVAIATTSNEQHQQLKEQTIALELGQAETPPPMYNLTRVGPDSPPQILAQLAPLFPSIDLNTTQLDEPITNHAGGINTTRVSVRYGMPVTAHLSSGINQTIPFGTPWSANGTLPAWLKLDTLTGVVTGTCPTWSTGLTIDTARSLKVGNFTLAFIATLPTLARETVQVSLVLEDDGPNRPPTLSDPTPNSSSSNVSWAVAAPSGSWISWTIPDDWTRDKDNDPVAYVAISGAGGPLPDWTTWNASTGTLTGVPTVITGISSASGNMTTQFANPLVGTVASILRGNTVGTVLAGIDNAAGLANNTATWSPSTHLWTTVVDPVGALGLPWRSVSVAVDGWQAPQPLQPVLFVSGANVTLFDLFATSNTTTAQNATFATWTAAGGIVAVTPASADLVLSDDGSHLQSNISGTFNIILMDSRGAMASTRLVLDVPVPNDSPTSPAAEPTTTPSTTDPNSAGAVVPPSESFWSGIDTSSASAFMSTAAKNRNVQILGGSVIGVLACIGAFSIFAVARRRHRASAAAAAAVRNSSGRQFGNMDQWENTALHRVSLILHAKASAAAPSMYPSTSLSASAQGMFLF
ncbi:hypothetical protein BC828DRAFT_85170 [Blastocladiella britannica]|nr:hypothetical protein BC828DRAFT_85170 [Blastocladiella britannica]